MEKSSKGPTNWKVEDAIYYNRHEHIRRHTLLLVSRMDKINWTAIDKYGPSLVITDNSTLDVKAILPNTTVLIVTSLVQSYWKFINYYRNQFQLPVVTITGTCGKTTTKRCDHTHSSGNGVCKHRSAVKMSRGAPCPFDGD